MKGQYESRRQARREALAGHERRARSFGTWRLVLLAAAVGGGWWNLAFPAVAAPLFIALLIAHDRLDRRMDAERRGIAFYDRGLARLEYRWSEMGPGGEDLQWADHLYAADFDLFGRGSLFQLMNSARTLAGEETLARWLQEPGLADEVRARQRAVAELKPQLDLREDLALLGENVRAGVHPEALRRWAEAAPVAFPGWTGAAIWLWNVLAAGALGGWLGFGWTWHPLAAVILGQCAFALWLRPRVMAVLDSLDTPARDLDILAALLRRLEKETFEAPRLKELASRWKTNGGQSAWQQIERLESLIERRSWGRNQAFAPVAALLLWASRHAVAIERWRMESGSHIREWLVAIGEFEALASMAGYAAEHPEDPFPELAADGEATIEASEAAHPLLPEATAVRNDIRLGGGLRLLVISGSNMSGKSTYLRTVGLNAALAWAGAPVRAKRMKVSRLRIGASIRVNDSLQEGKSRFYAEITRLRRVLDLAAGSEPALFLLDEVLSGTNSHDRRIGAEAVLQALVERGAIGMVTTHDLALADIAGTLGERAANVHFADHLEGEQIVFDYRMRPGVVRKSNALALMRSVGLSV